jgi:hypothetical protein
MKTYISKATDFQNYVRRRVIADDHSVISPAASRKQDRVAFVPKNLQSQFNLENFVTAPRFRN